MNKRTIYSIVALGLSLSILSCKKEEPKDPSLYAPTAIVTLKKNPSDGRFYMQLDDKTTLLPENVKEAPYGGKEVRAFVNYKLVAGDASEYTNLVHLNWADSVRTKSMAPSFAEPGANERKYGNDPVNISKNFWPTVVEDGYLTVVIETVFGSPYRHEVNLVKGTKPDEVILYHNSFGDTNGQLRQSVVAFRLDDLGFEGAEEKELTLKWRSFYGDREMKFKYLPRKFEQGPVEKE